MSLGTRRQALLWPLGTATLAILILAMLAWETRSALAPLPEALHPSALGPAHTRVHASDGTVLNRSYADSWNHHDRSNLGQFPPVLLDAVIRAEDQRFFGHTGPDWLARTHALWQNLRAGAPVRGASTISEQVVRMLHPRPRTLWSRWLEGFDAARLETRFGKTAVLDFYLNQVPYARGRRGLVQAARLYFDRNVDTLSPREMLTLAVLIRAPGRLDLYQKPAGVNRRVARLANDMVADGNLSPATATKLFTTPLDMFPPTLDLTAPHFVSYAKSRASQRHGVQPHLRTTLQPDLQAHVRQVLATRIDQLTARSLCDGAALAADHRTGAILAWVSFAGCGSGHAAIDAVRVRRQPGSTLKPFIYALVLEKGWTAATLVDDSPLSEMVGSGLHAYRNYSRRHYGAVTVREALANSLNIPSVKALQQVGAQAVLDRLKDLGITGLDGHPHVYGDGLALGNGEISLFSLAQAYAALANRGKLRRLRADAQDNAAPPTGQVFSAEISSLIADILSDRDARAYEFGEGGVLDLPVQTAVKTGTSSDHRDAWAVGFDHRHVVGVWLGNLDGSPMRELSGATGPAQIMRSVFAFLNRDLNARPLYLSPKLEQMRACMRVEVSGGCAHYRDEWFVPGTHADEPPAVGAVSSPRIRRPTPGLHLALDPRIPAHLQKFRLALERDTSILNVEWYVDGKLVTGDTLEHHDRHWTLTRGTHVVTAKVWQAHSSETFDTRAVKFEVR